jgi:DNA-directed RNA polymerase specialized sigma24 family protein
MTGALTASGTILHAQSQRPNQKRKPPSKTKYTRFDTLVGRYYPAVYSFASRLTDDPREAVSLTHDAFNTIRKRRWRLCDETILATILLNAVIVADLKAAKA